MTELRPYQLAGIDFLAARKRALLADDPGSGKSVQALKAAAKIGASRLLILCPAVGTVSWPDQIDTWQDPRKPTLIWTPERDILGIPPGPLNLIVSYSILSENRSKFLFALKKTQPFDAACLDECHYLKSRSSRRTQAVYSGDLRLSAKTGALHYLKPDAPVWIMSGTPWPNHFGEFYTHAVTLFPEFCQSVFFTDRVPYGHWLTAFCDMASKGFGAKPSGTKRSATKTINLALQPIMLRRRKKDIMPELKDPQHFMTPIQLDVPPDWDDTLLQALRDYGWDGTDQTLPDALRILSATNESVSSRRRMLGETKAKPAARWVQEYLNNAPADQKVIVFAHHKTVLDTLMKELSKFNPVRLSGGTEDKQRNKAVGAFQNDPSCRVFVGQTLAAGTSITLTAGSVVVMVEPDWVPGNNTQAIARAHRMGQQNEVSVYWLHAPKSLDQRITRILRHKTITNAETMGDPTP